MSGNAPPEDINLRRVQWHSSVESVRAGQISVLAVVETLAAIALFAYLVAIGHATYVVAAALLAPLLLLRTKGSTEYGFCLFRSAEDRIVRIFRGAERGSIEEVESTIQKYEAKIFQGDESAASMARIGENLVRLSWGFRYVPYAACLSIVAPLCKAAATAMAVARSPLETIRAIPQNWRRYIALMDMAHPWEFVPVPADAESLAFLVRLRDRGRTPWVRGLRPSVHGMSQTLSMYAHACTFLVAGALSTVYRWSIKGTAPVWLPLLWISIESRRNVMKAFRATSEYAWGKFIFGYSVAVVALLVAKYVLWYDASHSGQAIQFASAWNVWIAPAEFPRWQLAAGLNAFIGIVLFFVADSVLKRQAAGEVINEQALEPTMRTIFVGRVILTIYTSLGSLYVIATILPQLALPPIGEHWFPPGLADWAGRVFRSPR